MNKDNFKFAAEDENAVRHRNVGGVIESQILEDRNKAARMSQIEGHRSSLDKMLTQRFDA